MFILLVADQIRISTVIFIMYLIKMLGNSQNSLVTSGIETETLYPISSFSISFEAIHVDSS